MGTEYIFIKRRDVNNHFDTTDVKIKVTTNSLPELIEAMEDFIQACGYVLGSDKHLDIVEDLEEMSDGSRD